MELRCPKVALLFNCRSHFERAIVRGIWRYQHSHGPWQFFNGPEGIAPRFSMPPRWDGDGAIISMTGIGDFGFDISALHNTRFPVVKVSCQLAELKLPYVGIDYEEVGRMGAEHLIECGLRYVAFFGKLNHEAARLRRKGFMACLQEAGERVQMYPCPAPLQHLESWYQQVELGGRWLSEAPKPIGIMCYTDREARWLAQLCALLDIPIPEKVALLGVDDDPAIAQLCAPLLSSIRLPLEKVGYEAGRMLSNLMAQRPTSTELLLRPEGVVVRASSNLLQIDAPNITAALRFIRENTHRALKVADILEVVPVSRRYLEQRFRAVLGRTIHDEIRRQRLRQARDYLISTQKPVAEVARVSGFASLDHFYRSFREEFGETPGECRKAFQI